MNKQKELCNRINYEFHNMELLSHALTHSSYINDMRLEYEANNERLEFLGDAMLDAIISNYLYRRLHTEQEGQLSKLRALIVCENSLFKCAQKLDLGQHIRLGKGEEKTGGRTRPSILADAMEALIGAIYLDGGMEAVTTFVLQNLEETIEQALAGKLYSDYKTALQEKVQIQGEKDIRYEIDREEGPDHNKTFYITLRIDGQAVGAGSGRNKKEAEQHAAKLAMEGMGW